MVPLPRYSLERIPQESMSPDLVLRSKTQAIISESESIVAELGLDGSVPQEQNVVLARIQPFLIRLDNLEAEFSCMKGASLQNGKMSVTLISCRFTPPHPNSSTSARSVTILLQNKFKSPGRAHQAILHCL